MPSATTSAVALPMVRPSAVSPAVAVPSVQPAALVVVEPAPPKPRVLRQVVNVDVGLAGASTLPTIVPRSFILGTQRNHPESIDIIGLGGVDLENLSGDMPGRLLCSYDAPNNTWKTITTRLPEFIHHHGVVALEGRLYVVGEWRRWLNCRCTRQVATVTAASKWRLLANQ